MFTNSITTSTFTFTCTGIITYSIGTIVFASNEVTRVAVHGEAKCLAQVPCVQCLAFSICNRSRYE